MPLNLIIRKKPYQGLYITYGYTGIAWPSSARLVKGLVKSLIERNLHPVCEYSVTGIFNQETIIYKVIENVDDVRSL